MPNNEQKLSNRPSGIVFSPIYLNDDEEFSLGSGVGFNFGFKPVPSLNLDEDVFFTVPQLDDIPQDPIVETLKRDKRSNSAKKVLESKGLEAKVASSEVGDGSSRVKDEDVWTLPEVVAPAIRYIRTWDDFNPTTPHPSSSGSPFLSEQAPHIFDAVRYHLNFKLKDPSIHFQYILPEELWTNLRLNLLGNSSNLFIWDEGLCKLVPKTSASGKEIRVTLQGIGSNVFASAMDIFLNVGTNLRRIDEFIIRLRQSPESSPFHASFSHSLSSVLSYLQPILSNPPPFEMRQLVGISSWYKVYDQILKALVALCQCDGQPPFSFPMAAPYALLDHIFGELQKMLVAYAPREVIATLAYILTTTSKEWFYQLACSVGLIDTSRRSTGPPSLVQTYTSVAFTDEYEGVPSYSELDFESRGAFPSFFPNSLVTSILAARKSLWILKNAGLSCQASLDMPFTWVWTAEELGKRWLHERKDQREFPLQSEYESTSVQPSLILPSSLSQCSSSSKAEAASSSENDLTLQLISQFSVFNLPPGTHSHLLSADENSLLTAKSSSSSSSSSLLTSTTFSAFLTTFPDNTLPSITPTLTQLAHATLNPLAVRTTVLSNISLRLFLDSLHLNSHLRILRSYFFLASSSFKRRVVNALLYNESLDMNLSNFAATGGGTVNRKPLGASGVAIGLAAGLSSDKTWPPKGSDLSFSLRNVIVNSLEEDLEGALRSEMGVVLDAEQKLGFGLRDLPVEDGNARWLDPISIEALDFLYLDYKTSQPLDVVVTPQTIVKYQRIFTFLLRLTRVQTVMRITHQIIYSIHPSQAPLPLTSEILSIARTLHFQLSTFLSSLSGYIYDSIVGDTYDEYLAWIDQIRDELLKNSGEGSHSKSGTTTINFNIDNLNIFVLGESHSELLDIILKCCLLPGFSGEGSNKRQGKSKSTSRKVDAAVENAGGVLRNLMDLILRFGTVLMDLEVKGHFRTVGTGQSQMDDFNEAEEKLLILSEEFRYGMINLITAIQSLQETLTHIQSQKQLNFGGGFQSDAFLSRAWNYGDGINNYGFAARVVGANSGVADVNVQGRDIDQIHLNELITRLDPTYWWRRLIEKEEKESNII